MHHPTDRIIHTTAFVTPVVEHWLERELAQWVHALGRMRNNLNESTMRDCSGDPQHHELMLYHRAPLGHCDINKFIEIC